MCFCFFCYTTHFRPLVPYADWSNMKTSSDIGKDQYHLLNQRYSWDSQWVKKSSEFFRGCESPIKKSHNLVEKCSWKQVSALFCGSDLYPLCKQKCWTWKPKALLLLQHLPTKKGGRKKALSEMASGYCYVALPSLVHLLQIRLSQEKQKTCSKLMLCWFFPLLAKRGIKKSLKLGHFALQNT